MAEPMPASELDAIRARVAKTSNTYASLLMVQPSQAAVDRSALLAEVERLNGVALAAELERDVRLTAEDVERFLKRERDTHEARTAPWYDRDDILDAFRLHMVTGTPLTEPRPQEGTEALGVGPEPLTEAEELRAEVGRLTAELAAIRARAHARSEELLNARDARSSDDRERRRRFEFAAHEVRSVVRPSTTEEGER